jgi:integral membrane protein (TIGR00529 family)
MILKVLASLALILAANTLSRRLLLSVALGTVALALLLGHPAAGALEIAFERLTSPDTLLLLLLIMMVTWLSYQMSAAGIMKDLVKSVRSRVSGRTAMAALPAVIGLLPMAGGALFSAPLVDGCDREGRVPSLLKVQANYWFRHIWEYWWPLFPGVLLALDLTGLEVWKFALLQCPFTLVSIAAGRLFLLRNIRSAEQENDLRESPETPPPFLPLVAPIGVVVGVYALIHLVLPGLASAQRYLPLIIGVSFAMVCIQWSRRLDSAQWRKILLNRKTFTIAVLVAAVRVYGAFIEAPLPDGGALVEGMREELARWGIPLLAMLMVLPFVAGLTTGIAVGFVGASFPIVVSLLGDGASTGAYLAGVSLAYACGFAGMMLSPVHICLIVTNEHFQTRLPSSLLGLAKPAAAVVLSGAAYYFLVLLAIGG